MKTITKGIMALWTEISLVFLYLVTLTVDPTPTKAVFAQIAPGLVTAMQIVAGAFLTASVVDNGVKGKWFNPALVEASTLRVDKEDQ